MSAPRYFLSPRRARRTFQDAARGDGLMYCGATDDPETLEWLASLFLYLLDNLLSLDAVHRSFPWAAVCCLNVQLRAETLARMKTEWQFVTEVVDGLSPRHELHTFFGFTRYQPYRDVMTKAECLCQQFVVSLIHMYIYTYKYMYTCMYIHICIYMCVYIKTYMFHICIYTHINIHTHTYIYIYVYMHIYMHTWHRSFSRNEAFSTRIPSRVPLFPFERIVALLPFPLISYPQSNRSTKTPYPIPIRMKPLPPPPTPKSPVNLEIS